jgi:tubulin polyglutamylase TTLL9
MIDIHATNVSLQQKSPNYNQQDGCKWSLQSLKAYLNSRHAAKDVQGLFNDIEVMIIRSLLGVKDKIGADPDCSKCFEV